MTDITGVVSHNYKPQCISDFYGARHTAAKYIGINPSYLAMSNIWQHGWIKLERNNLIDLPTEENKKKIVLVSRCDQADFLEAHGVKSIPIGLPFSYALKMNLDLAVERDPNSILVIPRHVTRQEKGFNAPLRLLDTIPEQSKNLVGICLHGDDFYLKRNIFWEKNGYRVIKGASFDDANALTRMCFLFRSFDTLITDSLGSHIPYAAAAGMKIAVVPDLSSVPTDFKSIPFYRDKPQHAQHVRDVEMLCLNPQTSPYRFLFSSPNLAKPHVDWGLEQIGFDNLLSPGDLKKVLGWNVPSRYFYFCSYALRKSAGSFYRRLKHSFS